jgi:hypothetical protein
MLWHTNGTMSLISKCGVNESHVGYRLTVVIHVNRKFATAFSTCKRLAKYNNNECSRLGNAQHKEMY